MLRAAASSSASTPASRRVPALLRPEPKCVMLQRAVMAQLAQGPHLDMSLLIQIVMARLPRRCPTVHRAEDYIRYMISTQAEFAEIMYNYGIQTAKRKQLREIDDALTTNMVASVTPGTSIKNAGASSTSVTPDASSTHAGASSTSATPGTHAGASRPPAEHHS